MASMSVCAHALERVAHEREDIVQAQEALDDVPEQGAVEVLKGGWVGGYAGGVAWVGETGVGRKGRWVGGWVGSQVL